MLRWTSILGGLLIMMEHNTHSEALFYYSRLEDQVPYHPPKNQFNCSIYSFVASSIHATAKFQRAGGSPGISGVTGTHSDYPENQQAASGMEIGTGCDPLFGNIDVAECNPELTGDSSCSVMGPLQQFASGSGGSGIHLIKGRWANERRRKEM